MVVQISKRGRAVDVSVVAEVSEWKLEETSGGGGQGDFEIRKERSTTRERRDVDRGKHKPKDGSSAVGRN